MAKRERKAKKVGGGRELDFVEARARKLLKEGRAEEAASELEGALERGEEPRLRELLGRCYLALGRVHEAMASFSKALEGNPFSPGALLGLAEALERDGRRTKALQVYRRLLASNPEAPEAEEAIRRVEALQSERSFPGEGLSPEQVEQVEERLSDARFYLEVGQPRRARVEAEEALKVSPKNVEARLLIARALLEEGEPERARQYLEEALRIEPGNEKAKELMAKIGGEARKWRW